MSTNGSVDRLLIRLMSLSISSTRCQTCSRLPLKQYSPRRSTSLFHILTTDLHSPLLLRSYSTSSVASSILSTTWPINKHKSTISHHSIVSLRSLTTDLTGQRDATTSLAMIYCAKRNDPDQCLQHYLQLVKSQGTLPSHEALHQLARVLYSNKHLSGFSILHDTLLAYYTHHPLSAKQSRNLTYIYTMLINLIIRHPKSRNKRSSSSPKNKQQHASRQLQTAPSQQMSIPAFSPPPNTTTDTPPQQSTLSLATTASFLDDKTATIVQLCQEMRQLGLTGTPAFYNSLLEFCVMKKDVALAWTFFNELALLCRPTQHTFSILLNLTRQQRDPAGTLLVLDAMDQSGVIPDRAMISSLMLTLCDQRQYIKAADLVDQLACEYPQLVGPVYRSVLMDTLHRHFSEHIPHALRHRHRLIKRKIKRRQARLKALQQRRNNNNNNNTNNNNTNSNNDK